MKTIPPLVLLATLLSGSAPAIILADEQAERISAAFVLVLGRAPSVDEIGLWARQPELSVAELAARLQAQDEASVWQVVADKACADAFGRGATAEERRSWAAGRRTYTGLMQEHVRWLAGHPAEYAQVIERSYQQVLRRPAYAIELDYWKAQPPLPFALLNGCIENWARRNAPGLTATSGRATVSVNSDWLTAIRLSPAVAAEVRATAGLPRTGDVHLSAEAGRNVIAAGAGAVDSAGGIHFLATGR